MRRCPWCRRFLSLPQALPLSLTHALTPTIAGGRDVYLEAIEALPLVQTPEVFGLHSNADISYYTNATKAIWADLMDLQPRSSSVGGVSGWGGCRGCGWVGVWGYVGVGMGCVYGWHGWAQRPSGRTSWTCSRAAAAWAG